MGFGLDIKDQPLEFDKTDWVNYNGVMMPKNTARAKKAWVTMRAKEEKQSYDRNKKNKVRNEIVKIIKNNCKKNSNILTTDTKEFLLSNSLEDFNFVICEENIDEYKQMKKNKPLNVNFLHYGNIKEINYFNKEYAVVYLDFCCTFETAKSIIEILFCKIRKSQYFGFTFCLRKNKKKLEDYKIDMIKKIQDFLKSQPMPEVNGIKMKLDYDLTYGKSYRDKGHSPMITIFYKNNTSREIAKYVESLDFDTIHRICREKGFIPDSTLTREKFEEVHNKGNFSQYKDFYDFKRKNNLTNDEALEVLDKNLEEREIE